MDQPGKVANPARGQPNRENEYSRFPYVPENLATRDGFSRPVPRPACSFSILRLNLVPTYGIPPEFRGDIMHVCMYVCMRVYLLNCT